MQLIKCLITTGKGTGKLCCKELCLRKTFLPQDASTKQGKRNLCHKKSDNGAMNHRFLKQDIDSILFGEVLAILGFIRHTYEEKPVS